MLTLFETIAAIKALDTEKDVIQAACAKVLRSESMEQLLGEAKGYRKVAAEIVDRYMGREDVVDVIAGLSVALGSLGGATAKPGRESVVLNSIQEQVTAAFGRGMMQRLDEKLKSDKHGALSDAITILRGLRDIEQK